MFADQIYQNGNDDVTLTMEGASWAIHNQLPGNRATVAPQRWPDNVEFCLPPPAIADIPHYNNCREAMRMSYAQSDIDLPELEQRIELLQNSLPTLAKSIHYEPPCPQTRALQLETYEEPQKDIPTRAFTFVNVKTSTGRRDWAAETQIRSHAMKQIQQQRRKAKLSLRVVARNSGPTIGILPPRSRQDPETCVCHHLKTISTANLMQHETRQSLNITKDKNALPLAPSSVGWSKTKCSRCGTMNFLHRTELNSVSIPAANWYRQSSNINFLDSLNKANIPISPRIGKLLYYGK